MSNLTDRSRLAAAKLYNKALAAAQGSDKQLAYRLLVSAADVCPAMPEVWYALGNADGDMGLLEGAVAHLRRALQCEGIDEALRVKALTNLGQRLYNLGRWDEAEAELLEALRRDDRAAYAWSNLGLVASARSDHPTAIRHCRAGYEMAPEPMVEMALAFALLYAGRWAEGLKHWEARFPYKLTDFAKYPYPRWTGEKIAHLLVAAEQGLGDTLSFARFVPLAAERCESVTFVVPQALVSLLLGLTAWGDIRVIPEPPLFPDADAWCAVMSLPHAMGLSDEEIAGCQPIPLNIPFLPPNWKIEGSRLHVGVAWAGAKANDSDRWRSMPVVEMLELARVPGVALYSLQVGDQSQDIHSVGGAAVIRDLSPWIRDAGDTLAIMSQLDLTITVESFLGHLAGMAGLPCWVLMSRNAGDWRYGRDRDRPALWYEHRVFRQGEDRQWRPVIGRVVEALWKMRDGR